MIGISRDDKGGLARCWPFAAGGMLGPILSGALTIWLPLYSAAAASFFLLFFAAFWLFERLGGTGQHRFARNLTASAAGAAVVGLLAYLFPWKSRY